MSRPTLARLGVVLPLLPTTSVGSLPKPAALVRARRRFSRGELAAAALDDEARRATAAWIGAQERLGLDVLVDGEMYRGDMVAYFAEILEGFAPGGLVRSYGNRYYRKPRIVGPVRWTGPATVEWWRFAQSLTSRPVKGMLTGPYTMMDWSFDEHYADRASACLALTAALRCELEALVGAGARIVQIDEPALSVRPEELGLARDALGRLTDGIEAYVVTHACYGAFETIYPGILGLPVDNLDLAISHSTRDLLELLVRHPFSKDLSLGVIDVHAHDVPPQAEVEDRIRRAVGLIGRDAIWVSPACGLKTRTPDEAEAQLACMVGAARAVRAELEPAGDRGGSVEDAGG
jgi:5-methyltetrahydropteroyltriglutamate--homocysteine methyltransferase